jgi:hypothetical protein
MRKLWLAVVLCLGPWRPAAAFNPFQDVLDNTTFPVGQIASAGTAINLRNGDTSTSFLATVAQYRMLDLSAGGTRVNASDANFTDTVKLGFDLGWFFSQFKNSLPPQAQFLRNINLGPSYAISAVTNPGKGYPFFDINYSFH